MAVIATHVATTNAHPVPATWTSDSSAPTVHPTERTRKRNRPEKCCERVMLFDQVFLQLDDNILQPSMQHNGLKHEKNYHSIMPEAQTTAIHGHETPCQYVGTKPELCANSQRTVKRATETKATLTKPKFQGRPSAIIRLYVYHHMNPCHGVFLNLEAVLTPGRNLKWSMPPTHKPPKKNSSSKNSSSDVVR